MNAPKLLSAIAIFLTLAGTSLLTYLDTQLTLMDFISRLGEVNAQWQSWGNGLFMIAGVFWVGAIDTTRRSLEPEPMDSILRFSALAYAASYLLSVVFPCDEGCPATGSLNQILHNTVVWALFAGPAVFAYRVLRVYPPRIKAYAVFTLLVFVALQVDTVFFRVWPGLWQRMYEVAFCMMWWQVLSQWTTKPE